MPSSVAGALKGAFEFLADTEVAGESMIHKRGTAYFGCVVVLARRDLTDEPRNGKTPDFSTRQLARLETGPGLFKVGDTLEDSDRRYRIAAIARATPHSWALTCEVSNLPESQSPT